MDVVIGPATGSLLRSKLSPPQASADYLARPQVEAALSAHPHARLVLFCAPAGFGKTTALAMLVEQRRQAGSAVAWLSLGSADDEPVRFFQQLIEALGRALPGLGDYALCYLRNTMRVPV